MSKQTIDEILDELSFYGINDVSYCPGGHKLEEHARAQAKAAIQALIDEVIGKDIRLRTLPSYLDYGSAVAGNAVRHEQRQRKRKLMGTD